MPLSIWRYPDQSSSKRADALLRMSQLLLEGIRLHAVEGDAAELRKFQNDIQEVEKKLDRQTHPSEVFVLAGSIVRALQDYNLSTTRLLRRRAYELQEMVTMLTDTLSAISSDSDRSAAGLRAIESRLKKAASAEDIGSLKSSLEGCLQAVSEEATRKREETAKMITSLNESLQRTRAAAGEGESGNAEPVPETGHTRETERIEQRSVETKQAGSAAESLDPLTGLPERAAGEERLGAELRSRSHTFAVVFALPQLPTLNARFGYKVVDQILVFVREHISEGLPKGAALYRWSGAAFLALYECTESLDEIKGKLREVAPVRLRKSLNIDGREIFVIVAISCRILPVFEFPTERDLIRGIDWFVKAELKN